MPDRHRPVTQMRDGTKADSALLHHHEREYISALPDRYLLVIVTCVA